MKFWVVHDEDGRIRQTGSGPTPPDCDGLTAIEADPVLDDVGGCYVANGQLVQYSSEQLAARAARPSVYHQWSNALMGWVDQVRPDVRSAAERLQQRAALIELIVQAEAAQARPLREIMLARMAGGEAPEALQRLSALDAQICAWRAQLAGL